MNTPLIKLSTGQWVDPDNYETVHWFKLRNDPLFHVEIVHRNADHAGRVVATRETEEEAAALVDSLAAQINAARRGELDAPRYWHVTDPDGERRIFQGPARSVEVSRIQNALEALLVWVKAYADGEPLKGRDVETIERIIQFGRNALALLQPSAGTGGVE